MFSERRQLSLIMDHHNDCPLDCTNWTIVKLRETVGCSCKRKGMAQHSARPMGNCTQCKNSEADEELDTSLSPPLSISVQGDSYSPSYGPYSPQHSSYDPAMNSWHPQGNTFQMESPTPVQTYHVWNKARHKRVSSKTKLHPVFKVRVAVSRFDYDMRGLPSPKSHRIVELVALADIGTTMVAIGEKEVRSLRVQLSELLPISVTIQVADGRFVKPRGTIILLIPHKDEDGVLWTTRQQAYVMSGAHQLFLSHKALEELGYTRGTAIPQPMVRINKVPEYGTEEEETCKCPVRSIPPVNPERIPLPPTKENIDNLKEWTQEHFKAFMFNNCSHWKHLLVKGYLPLKLYGDNPVKLFVS